ncbi:MAG: ATP-dependent Clp protease adaptor ClpS [Treponema sp.]|nr:ATP-dependent Clp protease adaptor ClpS [Treponema sp.]
MTMSDYDSQMENAGSDVAEDTGIQLPPERKVVFYNDDFTTMEFVVDVLMSIYNKSHDEAENLMQAVHEEGSSVVGVYTFDIAVSRANLTKQIARKNGFPLRVEVE